MNGGRNWMGRQVVVLVLVILVVIVILVIVVFVMVAAIAVVDPFFILDGIRTSEQKGLNAEKMLKNVQK